MTQNVYPSTEELLTPYWKARLPATLVEEITTRYETLGEKYVTAHKRNDGRFINGMMYTSRVTNAVEEVVDAVFCMIGWAFKLNERLQDIPKDVNFLTLIPENNTAIAALNNAIDSLIDAYIILKTEELNDTYS